jgi:hypothetical protein
MLIAASGGCHSVGMMNIGRPRLTEFPNAMLRNARPKTRRA